MENVGGGGVDNASHVSMLFNRMDVGVIFLNKKFLKRVRGV